MKFVVFICCLTLLSTVFTYKFLIFVVALFVVEGAGTLIKINGLWILH